MARPSDREYALQRKIKDLETKNERLELEVKNLRKQIDKSASEDVTKKKLVPRAAGCPDCGALIKCLTLPGVMLDVCSKACGFKKVHHEKL